jgi:hypothetical protein
VLVRFLVLLSHVRRGVKLKKVWRLRCQVIKVAISRADKGAVDEIASIGGDRSAGRAAVCFVVVVYSSYQSAVAWLVLVTVTILVRREVK